MAPDRALGELEVFAVTLRALPKNAGEAIRAFPEHRRVVKLIAEVSGYPPALEMLAALWHDCPVVPIQNAAGRALRQMGTREARDILIASMNNGRDLARKLGVRALIEEDPATSFERLRAYFEDPGEVANEILWFFCPSMFQGDKPSWVEPREPKWLSDDWLALCARLRRHPRLGANARTALRYAPSARVDRALAAAPLPPPPAPVKTARGDRLSRYLRGEFVEVWDELRAYPSIDGELRLEALEVARATMERVRDNVALVASRLAARGWIALSGALHTPPESVDVDAMKAIEARTGAPLPPSLRAFWEIVGGVDLVWDYERGDAPALGVDLSMADALAVDPARTAVDLIDEWDDRDDGVRPELRDPYKLDLAPDLLHKADISGGPPYGIELPFWGADPIWANEPHGFPFVDYLRHCLRWGGFGNLDRTPGAQSLVDEISAGMLEF